MKSIAKIWSLVLVVLMVFASCEPEMRENVTDAGNPSDIGLLTDPFTLNMYSSLASRIPVVQRQDGTTKYVDGTEIEKAGLLLQMDKDYPDRCLDTIWAKTTPVEGLVAEWEIEDESILECVETSELPSYIVVKALKEGKTKVTAKIEDRASKTIDVIVGTKWVKSLKYNVGGQGVGSASGTFYDYDVRAQNDPKNRMDQYVLGTIVKAEEAGAEVGYPVTWEFTSSDTSIITNAELFDNLKVTRMGEFNDFIMIETVKDDGKGLIARLNEGKDPSAYVSELNFTITARAAYFTVEAMMTIKPTNAITPIESVTWLDMERNPTTTYALTTESKSLSAPTELSVLALPVVTDHLVGGFRFGIDGVDGYLNNNVLGNKLSNDYVSLHTLDDTKAGGVVGVRGLKQGTVTIWVEIGDAGLGGNFTVEEYGEPKRAELTITVSSVITDIKVYDETGTDEITETQKMTEGGETKVFVAKIFDDEAHDLFKNSIEWKVGYPDGNNGYNEVETSEHISIAVDPSDPARVTVTPLAGVTGNAAPRIWVEAKDNGKSVKSSVFAVEVEELPLGNAKNLTFTSVSCSGSSRYTYTFTTDKGESLVINTRTNGNFLFDEMKKWTLSASAGQDIRTNNTANITINDPVKGDIVFQGLKEGVGTITVEDLGDGNIRATIDFPATPVVGGVQKTLTSITGVFEDAKPTKP